MERERETLVFNPTHITLFFSHLHCNQMCEITKLILEIVPKLLGVVITQITPMPWQYLIKRKYCGIWNLKTNGNLWPHSSKCSGRQYDRLLDSTVTYLVSTFPASVLEMPKRYQKIKYIEGRSPKMGESDVSIFFFLLISLASFFWFSDFSIIVLHFLK